MAASAAENSGVGDEEAVGAGEDFLPTLDDEEDTANINQEEPGLEDFHSPEGDSTAMRTASEEERRNRTVSADISNLDFGEDDADHGGGAAVAEAAAGEAVAPAGA